MISFLDIGASMKIITGGCAYRYKDTDINVKAFQCDDALP